MSQAQTKEYNTTVRVLIDGNWTADGMSEFLSLCSTIYYLNALPTDFLDRYQLHYVLFGELNPVEAIKRDLRWRHGDRLYPLRVTRIQYGSPGFIEFVGAITGLNKLYDLLRAVVDRSISRRKLIAEAEGVELNNELTRLHVQSLKNKLAAEERQERMILITQQFPADRAADEVMRRFMPEIDKAIAIAQELADSQMITEVEQRSDSTD